MIIGPTLHLNITLNLNLLNATDNILSFPSLIIQPIILTVIKIKLHG